MYANLENIMSEQGKGGRGGRKWSEIRWKSFKICVVNSNFKKLIITLI